MMKESGVVFQPVQGEEEVYVAVTKGIIQSILNRCKVNALVMDNINLPPHDALTCTQ